MLVTAAGLLLVLFQGLSPSEPEAWPSGSLAKAPFEERPCRTDAGEADSPPAPFLDPEELFDLRRDFAVQEPKAAQEALPPHGSFEGAFRSHGSSDAWRDFVGEDYLSQPAVLLPVGLALSAVAVSHWDRRLERQWHGLLGGRQTLGNIGAYTLLGASVLIGVAAPGEGRNSWDELWTIAEAYAASTLTSSVMKYGVARYRPGHGTHSFPSGHSSIAFTGATLIERNSGELWGIPAYALAAFTGFERVEAGRHFPSDVLVGAAVGSFSAGIFDALHWGRSGEGGIVRRQGICSVEMDGVRGGRLEFVFDF